MKRNLWFWMYFIAAILLSIYFAARIIMAHMGYGPTAMIQHISISADTNDKDLTPIIAAAGIAPGTHSRAINLELVNERIAQTPGVRKSTVRRLSNGNLAIRVKLYTAVAEWTDGTFYYPISADGTIVKKPSETRGIGTIVFRGNVPNEIGEITKAAHNLVGNLDYLEWIDGRRWNLVTLGGITIMLPENDPIAAIGNIVVLDKKHNILSKDIKIIDMRDDTRILVK
ncbi:MAG: cell division protein FtsQ/DivIB [Alphaproteobacteria bacterium]|nr:cell division protein FtsQ/DivIB [Alphaproteobacteria bacterium]